MEDDDRELRCAVVVLIAVAILALLMITIQTPPNISLCDGEGNDLSGDERPLIEGDVKMDIIKLDDDRIFYRILEQSPVGIVDGAHMKISANSVMKLKIQLSCTNGYLLETGALIKLYDRDSGKFTGSAELSRENGFTSKNDIKVTDGSYSIELYTLKEYCSEVDPQTMTNMEITFTIDEQGSLVPLFLILVTIIAIRMIIC